MRPRMSSDGARRWLKHVLTVMVMPIDVITENTVMNDRPVTSRSGMTSVTANPLSSET